MLTISSSDLHEVHITVNDLKRLSTSMKGGGWWRGEGRVGYRLYDGNSMLRFPDEAGSTHLVRRYPQRPSLSEAGALLHALVLLIPLLNIIYLELMGSNMYEHRSRVRL